MRIDINDVKYTGLSGGEFRDSAGYFDEYYIELDDLYICMTSKNLKKLAVDAINHLMVNEHDFEFFCNKDGFKEIK